MIQNFQGMLDILARRPRKTVVVASAEDEQTLGAVRRALASGLATAVLTGRQEKLEAAARAVNLGLDEVRVVLTGSVEESARAAVREVSDGRAHLLMKGKLHTSELLKAVLDKPAPLRTGRMLSHVFILELDRSPRLLLVTDGGINLAPDEETLLQITQNAVALARLFVPRPRVAMLSALDSVNERLPSTVIARRIQERAASEIPEADVQGPLTFDEAISELACRRKGLTGPAAGRADIAVVPYIEMGNALVRALIYLAGARAAGLVVGGRCPIVLASRSDSEETKFLSLALGLFAYDLRFGPPGEHAETRPGAPVA